MKRSRRDLKKSGVNVTVSEKSTDKLTDALLDVFSPLRQGLGLVGDRIKFYRQQQRITLTKTLREAEKIAKENNLNLEAPPPKFLLPYLDSASLEDDTDESMRKKYANLLVNAGQGADSATYFARTLLAELSPVEAKLLDYIVSTTCATHFDGYDEYTNAWETELEQMVDEIEAANSRYSNGEINADQMNAEMISSMAAAPHVIARYLEFSTHSTPLNNDNGFAHFNCSNYTENFVSYLILSGRQIINYETFRREVSGPPYIYFVAFISLTQLGYSVVKKLYRPMS